MAVLMPLAVVKPAIGHLVACRPVQVRIHALQAVRHAFAVPQFRNLSPENVLAEVQYSYAHAGLAKGSWERED